MKNLLIFTLLLSISFIACADSAKQVCDSLQPIVKQIQDQLPIKVDHVTDSIGIQSLYVSETCFVNYNFLIDTDGFAAEIAEADESTKEVLSFLKSEEGYKLSKSIIGKMARDAASVAFGILSNQNGVRITYTYSFDNLDVQSIIVVVLDTT